MALTLEFVPAAFYFLTEGYGDRRVIVECSPPFSLRTPVQNLFVSQLAQYLVFKVSAAGLRAPCRSRILSQFVSKRAQCGFS